LAQPSPERSAESSPESSAAGPLAGIRVLDLTSVVMGPLADKSYIGAGQHVLISYRGRGKPPSQRAANSASPSALPESRGAAP